MRSAGRASRSAPQARCAATDRKVAGFPRFARARPAPFARGLGAVAVGLLFATAAGATSVACAGPSAEAKPATPSGLSPGLTGVRVRVRRDPAALDQEVGAALETELARAGAAVATDDRAPADADVKIALDLRSVGPVVEGIATASVERGGTLVDRVSTALDVYRRDRFPALVARQLADALAKSPRVAALAGGPAAVPAQAISAAAPAPLAVAPPPTPSAAPPAAAAPPPPVTTPQPSPSPVAAAPAAPAGLGRSGRLGWGLGFEAQVGWAQVWAPGSAPAGVHLALAVQGDMGPHAAFRLPLSFAGASSGDNQYAEIAFVPTYLYRFRSQVDQAFVPYVGLGVALKFIDAGRALLGRPETTLRSSDSCSSRTTTNTARDCAFAISPEPTAGVEWQGSRLFTLDMAASYSFAHLTSSTGIVSWVHVLTIFVGPRLTL